MADQTFKVGDLVQLKSGGPIMTVSEIYFHRPETKYWCQWFAASKLARGLFASAELQIPKKKLRD